MFLIPLICILLPPVNVLICLCVWFLGSSAELSQALLPSFGEGDILCRVGLKALCGLFLVCSLWEGSPVELGPERRRPLPGGALKFPVRLKGLWWWGQGVSLAPPVEPWKRCLLALGGEKQSEQAGPSWQG